MIQHPDVVTIGGRFGWAINKALVNRHPNWQFLFIMRDQKKIKEASNTGQVESFFSDKIIQNPRPGLGKKILLTKNVSFCSLDEFNTGFRGTIKKLFIPALPSSRMRSVLDQMLEKGIPKACFSHCQVLSVSKGMEPKTLLFPHEIIDDILGVNAVVALGGNLAFEFAVGDPMLMELAGYKSNTHRTADFFLNTNLIICETLNRRKLSLAGPMKNIHSLATGMTSEIFGSSSVSTVATMGLSEYERAAFIIQFKEKLQPLARIIQKIPFNFRSVPIAGGAMSDYHLFRFTRNFNAGQALIKEIRTGKNTKQAMEIISKGTTIESFASAVPVRDYLRQSGCSSPVIEITVDILNSDISPEKGIQKLITQKNLRPS
ncbi:MAG: hypothetical protein L3J69_15995 [Desulfobacula sp.]|nr:hypothetical protein [Desulfobacula sp.]